MDKKEIIELFELFLNEYGQWYNFKTWLEKRGYKLEELGLIDDSE